MQSISDITYPAVSFVDALLAYGPASVCFTGGGGKTTLIYGLAGQLAARGMRVLVSTSTRMRRPGPGQTGELVDFVEPDMLQLPGRSCVVVAARPNAEGRNPDYLSAFTPKELDELWNRRVADWMLVKADGSARRPLKAPASKEPVIPKSCGLVVAVVGLSGLGRHFTDTWVYRPAAFAQLSNLEPGERITADALARVIRHERGLFKGAPAGTPCLVFLNQSDLPGAAEAGKALGKAIKERQGLALDGVYMGCARDPEQPCLKLL